ncbi:helix-turn-helix transcriptional regulator [Prevotella lacticifex]|uniref:helix-turn-helix transcriptional regulator n=1 Tax=Prevotella lacticifex TaxID=2854755 RepID=UPI001CC656CE|nr:helix-turn-helix domain-containing protein [Prevotella lacticifex]GJG53961.1 hypothetical protein PRLR5064_31830 [Prevotella lacticifex]
MSPFINQDAVAEHLKIKDPGTIRKLVRDEGLPAHRIGSRRLLFDRDEVDAWVRSRASGNPDSDQPGVRSGSPEGWVADQVAKFGPDDLRRAATLLTSLARDLEVMAGSR